MYVNIQELKDRKEMRKLLMISCKDKEEYKQELKRISQERVKVYTRQKQSDKQPIDRLVIARARLAREAEYNVSDKEKYQSMLAIGKVWELEVANLLKSFGFEVRDISEMQYMKDKEYFYYPFDILFEFGSLRFLADIKYRKSGDYISTWQKRLDEWHNFSEFPDIPSSNRLLIIAKQREIKYCSIDDLHCIRYWTKSKIEITPDKSIHILRKQLEKE